MARASNTLFGIINCLSLLLGIAAVASSLYFRLHGGATDCQKALQSPLLVMGLVLSVVSLLALVGSCCKAKWVLVFYFVAVVVLVLALLGLTVFALVVTNKGAAKKVRDLGLDDYSGWLKKHFIYGKNWDDIRSCLADSQVCKSISSNAKVSEFLKKNLSPIQAGCCEPPDYCGYEHKNRTYWEAPQSEAEAAPPRGMDCEAWGNEEKKLCYDCQSCKRGVLATIRKQWRALAVVNALAIALVILTLSIGCCAMSNNKLRD